MNDHLLTQPLPAGVDGGAAGAAWTATHDGPQRYPRVHIERDVPITMSDGVVLRADVYRPAYPSGQAVAEPTPTIVNLTPYTKLAWNVMDKALSVPGLSAALTERSRDFAGSRRLPGLADSVRTLAGGYPRNISIDRQLIRSGYTQVVVDVRGTGHSQGVYQLFGAREQRDTLEVFDWVTAQPWSTGDIGMNGVSYSGINQFQAAAHRPPALKAIFPGVAPTDGMLDGIAPGGGLGLLFTPVWMSVVNLSKLLPPSKPLRRGGFDRQWLRDRRSAPFSYLGALGNWLTATRLDRLGPEALAFLDPQSPVRQGLRVDVSSIEVPTFVFGAWHDIFVSAQVKAYNALRLPPGRKQLLMGFGDHLNMGHDLGRPGEPPRLDVLQRAWFDRWLKGIDNGIDEFGPVTAHQMGGEWIRSTALPEHGTKYRRLYLSAATGGTAPGSVYDGSLTTEADPAVTRLTVAPGIAGIRSRDTSLTTIGLFSAFFGSRPDAARQETGGLSFTSAPVTAPTTVNGPITVHLTAIHDAIDGFWAVTVNDVSPDGYSTVLGSGQLVTSLRAKDELHSTRLPNGDFLEPVYPLAVADRLPVEPGTAVALDIPIPAISAHLRPGHRLRVNVYAGNFPRAIPMMPMLVDSGRRPQHLHLDPAAASFVTIGLLGAPGW
ncbi:CocE/NonD family hydrolase [Nocardia sp. 2]|uniref:CocE/NonD family hydrolase n=1 Tax=Nocardia acididurans TaxID=2802282 RepID=A0ABS1LYX4_9NOCA|nr:CocE/NonD family hydrolase [Nocardia acididurans]MBL1073411.1 CocE/NonD family hydrolase [Nocardia acididurans]